MCDGCWRGSFPAGWVCFPPSSPEKVRVLLHVSPHPQSPPQRQWFLQQVPSARELSPLPTLTLGPFSTFPGLRPLSLRSMCVAFPYKEALGDGISRIRRDSHMSSSSNWYSKLYTFKCHQEREKELSASLAFQHLHAGHSAFLLVLKAVVTGNKQILLFNHRQQPLAINSFTSVPQVCLQYKSN